MRIQAISFAAPAKIQEGLLTRLALCPLSTRPLVSAALSLLNQLPEKYGKAFWEDQFHGYFHGFLTVEIAARLAGARLADPLFARALVLSCLIHDVTAFEGRDRHAQTGSELVFDACKNSPFWRPVAALVRGAILSHEGRAPNPRPRNFLEALVHDADRLQEISDTDRIKLLSDRNQRKFFDPALSLDWRRQVLLDRTQRDNKRNDNQMYFMDNLFHCFERDNFMTEAAHREALGRKPWVVERMRYWIAESYTRGQISFEEMKQALDLLGLVLRGDIIEPKI